MRKLLITLTFALVSILAFANDTLTVAAEDLNAALDSLAQKLQNVDGVADVPGQIGDIVDYTVIIKEDIAYIIKNAPQPDDAEGVGWWIEFIGTNIEVVLAVLLYLITALFKIFKADPTVATTVVGKALSFVRTRAFIPVVGVILTIVGLVFFKEGSWSIGEAVFYLFSAILGGVGLNEVIQWIVDLFKKDVQVEG